ncbi:radical SAM family heme chaperone HemW [Saccharospirillum impatiens]|uniref:radical SAM family heme chaperone HemW n=1 Tax=Saccharospirillum impatiens TaxID=169438 RepID=UPI0004071EE9|nr:radical SAM family heme chaperone HemW [Saccharospirillum impatiens]
MIEQPDSLPTLSAYVHVPWCVRKCPYCDFNSHALDPDKIPETAYLKRLFEDLEQDAPLAQGRPLRSVFFGGGTPSLLSPGAIGQILEQLERKVGFTADCEITLEANPGTVDEAHFRGFRDAGVNRLSIGIQSFNDAHLQRLGRIHNSDQALRAGDKARAAGFDNFNLDLMHGLPDQTETEAMADLNQAIELGPSHLSWYQLTIEPNTEFYRKPPALPADDTLWAIQEAGQARLSAAGFAQYEVSAYAQPGQRCQHNLNYWGYGDYLGIGPGAHGKVTRTDPFDIVRTRKTRLPKDYLDTNRLLIRHEEKVAIEDRPFDYFINTLRLVEGCPAGDFSRATGLAWSSIEPTLLQLRDQGMLEWERGSLRTTDRGFLYLNDLLTHWLP